MYDSFKREAVLSHDGLYFISYNLYFSTSQNNILFRRSDSNRWIKMTSNSPISGGERILKSVSGLFYLHANTTVHIEAKKATSVFGTEGKTMSWLMFRYQTNNYIYAVTASSEDVHANGIVYYKSKASFKGIELYDTKKFKIIQEGLYYIYLGISALGESFRMMCVVNNLTIQRSIVFRGKNYEGESVSKAFVHYFQKDDIFWCQVLKGTLRAHTVSSIVMLKLNSSSKRPLISVATENEEDQLTSNDPMPFTKIFAIEGNNWDILSNTYDVKVAGLYFMYIGVGSYPNKQVHIEILVNDNMFATVERSQSSMLFDVVSRTLTFKLNVNDEVKLRNKAGFKSDYYTTSFTMFYISA